MLTMYTVTDGSIRPLQYPEAWDGIVRTVLYSDHTVETERMADVDQGLYIRLQKTPGTAVFAEVSRDSEMPYHFTADIPVSSTLQLSLNEYERSIAVRTGN